VIIDIRHFIESERPYWNELESFLEKDRNRMERRPTLSESRRMYYLYRRASSDLAKVRTFAAEPDLRQYLETLVARTYADMHAGRRGATRLQPVRWLTHHFPQVFRRQRWAFYLSTFTMLFGTILGASLIGIDLETKRYFLPFGLGGIDPSERVAMEESGEGDDRQGEVQARFSAMLMTNNTMVSINTLALGVTFGVGSIVLLFYNGVILGGVALDYILAGESVFLAGWLLPHGSIEIPAILIAGQAGLVLGHAMIGYGTSESIRTRLRTVAPDLVTLIFGVALLLVWAGIVESFFSQYHAPVLPYWFKIGFGLVEMAALFAYLAFAGRRSRTRSHARATG